MTTQHKVGQMHYYGKIVADAYKYDMSGQTVSMYDNVDKSEYVVVEWDKDGQTELKVDKYDNDEMAVISYVERTWGISV